MDILTFAQDKDVEIAVRDYFNDFLKSQNRYSGYVDNTISFAEKEKNVNRLVMAQLRRFPVATMILLWCLLSLWLLTRCSVGLLWLCVTLWWI